MRDEKWLKQKLEQMWTKFFPDIKRGNFVDIKFGRNSRTRLGSIKLIPSTNITHITITGFFKNEAVPEEIIDSVIGHEVCHYAHGFSSPLPKLFRYPHQGGLVDSELKKRGFAEHLLFQKKWLKEEWPKIVGRPKRRRTHRSRKPKQSLLEIIFGL